METTSCRVSSDRLRITQASGVITANVSGLIGLPECLGMVRRLQASSGIEHARGILVDLRGAALVLSTPNQCDEAMRVAEVNMRRRLKRRREEELLLLM